MLEHPEIAAHMPTLLHRNYMHMYMYIVNIHTCIHASTHIRGKMGGIINIHKSHKHYTVQGSTDP